MKILFLIPPSEWKSNLSSYKKEELSFLFEKPNSLWENASEKDLKCTWDRYKQALELNKNISNQDTIEAIKRYNWVMYNFIDYENISQKAKIFFENNFLIFSGMYGILKPLDKIANYKLAVETKWLYQFWWDKIPEKIIELKPDYIVNLLPDSYAKLIWLGTKCNRHKKKLENITNNGTKIINIVFLKQDWKKISHWVKKFRWVWIKDICERNIVDYKQFWWEIIEVSDEIIDINIIIK